MTQKEKALLKTAVRDILWMARRYADGRYTYAPEMFNESQKILVDILGREILKQPDDTVKNYPYAMNGNIETDAIKNNKLDFIND